MYCLVPREDWQLRNGLMRDELEPGEIIHSLLLELLREYVLSTIMVASAPF